VAKRSLSVAGHRTSVSLEEPFWTALSEIARIKRTSVAELVATIDTGRPDDTNLSAAIRIFALEWFRDRARLQPTEPGQEPSAGRRRGSRARG
jgi:predicted DNA-binding ribbon-helix-helix protein